MLLIRIYMDNHKEYNKKHSIEIITSNKFIGYIKKNSKPPITIKTNGKRDEIINDIRNNRNFNSCRNKKIIRNKLADKKHEISSSLSSFLEIPNYTQLSNKEILQMVRQYCSNNSLIKIDNPKIVILNDNLRKLFEISENTIHISIKEFMDKLKQFMIM